MLTRKTHSRHRLRRDGDEMMVALMAMIAACVLQPDNISAINKKGAPTEVVAKVSAAGFPVSEKERAAREFGEKTMFNRAGGARPRSRSGWRTCLRVSPSPTALALWYHFAIMFEALFILTTIDAGTRVGRFLLQDLLGKLAATARRACDPGALISFQRSACRGLLGWFLYQGVIDPLGGINSLWPLFGIANQLLSIIALCLGTTLPDQDAENKIFLSYFNRARIYVRGHVFRWLPESFSADPKIGFLSGAQSFLRSADVRVTDFSKATWMRSGRQPCGRFDAIASAPRSWSWVFFSFSSPVAHGSGGGCYVDRSGIVLHESDSCRCTREAKDIKKVEPVLSRGISACRPVKRGLKTENLEALTAVTSGAMEQ